MANEKVVMIPIVVGALGTITTFKKYIESLVIEIRIEHIQKSALLGTAKIIRTVLPRKGYCCWTFGIWLMSALAAKTRIPKSQLCER